MAVFRYFELREACRQGGKRNVAAAGRPLQAHKNALQAVLNTTPAYPLDNQQKPRDGAFFCLGMAVYACLRQACSEARRYSYALS